MQVIRQFISTFRAENVRFFFIVDSLCFCGSEVQRSCSVILFAALLKAKGGGERGVGGEEEEQGLERGCGGIHAQGPATISSACG